MKTKRDVGGIGMTTEDSVVTYTPEQTWPLIADGRPKHDFFNMVTSWTWAQIQYEDVGLPV